TALLAANNAPAAHTDNINFFIMVQFFPAFAGSPNNGAILVPKTGVFPGEIVTKTLKRVTKMQISDPFNWSSSLPGQQAVQTTGQAGTGQKIGLQRRIH